MDVAQLRREYTRLPLEREDLNPDPIEQFGLWLKQSAEAEVIEPNAMTVATVGADGRPSSRTVLLKAFDSAGFVFFTNLESNKARQISENANVSLLFPWLALARQVIINGAAENVSTAQVLKYFVTRPLGNQLGAWASPQSKVISSRSILEAKLDEVKKKFLGGQIPLPSFWGGFRVVPRTIEFWQGGENRLHDRFLYTRLESGGWQIDRLAP